MSNEEYFDTPIHTACHNYVTTTDLPAGTSQLLGLNLKFCLELPKPFNKIEDGISRLTHNVRLHHIHNSDKPLDPNTQDFVTRIQAEAETYEPKLYIKSTWKPPYADNSTESALSNFNKDIRAASNQLPKHQHYNLTKSQLNTLSNLMKRSDLVVLLSDKNLGPAIIERSKYIKGVLHQHLLKNTHYKRIHQKDIT